MKNKEGGSDTESNPWLVGSGLQDSQLIASFPGHSWILPHSCGVNLSPQLQDKVWE